MNDPDQTVIWPSGMGDGFPERFWADEKLALDQERAAADVTTGLVSFAFIKAALKRSAWLWCLTAVAGLLIGSALFVKYPPAFHASASVLLVDNPNQDPAVEVQTDANLAQSQAVASHVVRQLGLHQTVASFQAAYTATVITDTVLTFNVGAPSSTEAVRRASALTTAFLQYRAQYMRAQQQQLLSELDQQYNAAQKELNSINAQISELSAQPSSPEQQTKINNLLTRRGNQEQIEQYVTGARATAKTTAASVVANSQVLNSATPIPHSHLKSAGLYIVGGLFGGVVAGMAIIIISALVSNRVRRREDVAAALGAPVRLSVGRVRKRGWLPSLPGRSARRNLNMRRVVTHLQGAVPGSSRGAASLAVVAVDDALVTAEALVSVARSFASRGKQVVVADLSSGARLAALFKVTGPGVHQVGQGDAPFVVALPQRDDIAPVGPLHGVTLPVAAAQADDAVVDAYTSADLLLTLATLDPAFGGDHLATWATDAVAVVTAGRSSAEMVHSVGEMLRLAGLRLDSVVLLEADKSDESLGVAPAPDEAASVSPGLRF